MDNIGKPTIGSDVSLASALLHLPGESPPGKWDGHRFFGQDHTRRAYFSQPPARGQYLLGIREEEWRYIINASHGTEQRYSLADAPLEQVNVAGKHPENASDWPPC